MCGNFMKVNDLFRKIRTNSEFINLLNNQQVFERKIIIIGPH